MKWNERDEQASLEAYHNGTLEPMHPQHIQQLIASGAAVPEDVPVKDIWQEYVEAEEEMEAQSIEFFSSMSEGGFMDWIIDVINDPDSRSSMMVAVIREGIRFRRGNG